MRTHFPIVGIACLALSLVSCQGESKPVPVPVDGGNAKAPKEPEAPAKDEGTDNYESPWDSVGIRVEGGRFGVTVTEVRNNSPAAEARLRVGDYIDRVGDNFVNTAAEFNAAVRSRKAGEQISITRSTKGGLVERFGWDPSPKKKEKP